MAWMIGIGRIILRLFRSLAGVVRMLWMAEMIGIGRMLEMVKIRPGVLECLGWLG